MEVVPLSGWRRDMTYHDTGRRWIPASPNLPRIEGVLIYPGMVLVEGTNLSEGRGTTTPFEVVGAPFIDPYTLVDALKDWALPGIAYRPLAFKPTFQKWQDQTCGGVYFHILDDRTCRPYRTAVALLGCLRQLYPSEFQWLQPPYEYEQENMPIDILSGGSELREALERGLTKQALEDLTTLDETAWWQEAKPFLLYQ